MKVDPGPRPDQDPELWTLEDLSRESPIREVAGMSEISLVIDYLICFIIIVLGTHRRFPPNRFLQLDKHAFERLFNPKWTEDQVLKSIEDEAVRT